MKWKEPLFVRDARKFLFSHPKAKRDIELWKWAYGWLVKAVIALCIAVSSPHWGELARLVYAFR